jgi:hypothetical protein
MHHVGCMTGPELYTVQGNRAILMWCTLGGPIGRASKRADHTNVGGDYDR